MVNHIWRKKNQVSRYQNTIVNDTMILELNYSKSSWFSSVSTASRCQSELTCPEFIEGKTILKTLRQVQCDKWSTIGYKIAITPNEIINRKKNVKNMIWNTEYIFLPQTAATAPIENPFFLREWQSDQRKLLPRPDKNRVWVRAIAKDWNRHKKTEAL